MRLEYFFSLYFRFPSLHSRMANFINPITIVKQKKMIMHVTDCIVYNIEDGMIVIIIKTTNKRLHLFNQSETFEFVSLFISILC